MPALEHTPLSENELSPAAKAALGDPARKMMAARNLAPIPDPRDLASVLYQLAGDADAAIAQAAKASMAELPEGILAAALANPQLPARVIDAFADRVKASPALAAQAIASPAIADETVAELASSSSTKVVELCAENETRLLRCPAIVAALYNNPRTPMSLAARTVELCARNGVRVAGIAAWDEVAAAHMKVATGAPSAADDDAVFARAMSAVTDEAGADTGAEKPAAPAAPPATASADDRELAKDTPISALPIAMKIRLAMLGNASARATLIRDPARPVAMAAIKAPAISESEVTRYAASSALSDDVIGYIASRRDWVKLYGVKLALVQNPKTPLTASTRLLAHLRERDLKAIARSKSVPSALTAQAKKLITQRRRGGGRA